MEHLREYQDYLLAYRLRARVGGALRPAARELDLAEYAALRIERQRLARGLLGDADYRDGLRRVDALTDRLNFGFWHNPSETAGVLRKIALAGGCAALESEGAFVAELLTRAERARLGDEDAERLAGYYLGLLRASAAWLDPAIFTRLRDELDARRDDLPLFVELGGDPAVA